MVQVSAVSDVSNHESWGKAVVLCWSLCSKSTTDLGKWVWCLSAWDALADWRNAVGNYQKQEES